jgi:hypothetical protein
LIATTGGLLDTIDIEVEAARPSKPTWDCVSDTEVVEGWFELDNAEFPNIDGVSTTVGIETNPEMSDVATGSVVNAGVVDVEGCEVKLDDDQPFKVGLNGVWSETCSSSVVSSCRLSASVASTSSTTLSLDLIFVDKSPVISETVKSSRTTKGAGLIATAGATTEIEAEATEPLKPTWGWVSDTALVEGGFKPENAEFPNIEDMSKILGVENDPVKADVVTGGAVGAGAVEGCGVKPDDNQPSELGLS